MLSPRLPKALTNCIASSQAEVLSWSAKTGELVLQIRKDGGQETGTVLLSGVAYVYLPPRFVIIGVGLYNRPFPDYPHLELADGQIAFAAQDSESHVHLIVAEHVTYRIDSETEKTAG